MNGGWDYRPSLALRSLRLVVARSAETAETVFSSVADMAPNCGEDAGGGGVVMPTKAPEVPGGGVIMEGS